MSSSLNDSFMANNPNNVSNEELQLMYEEQERASIRRLFLNRVVMILFNISICIACTVQLATYDGNDSNNHLKNIVIVYLILYILKIPFLIYSIRQGINMHNESRFQGFNFISNVHGLAKIIIFICANVYYNNKDTGHFTPLVLTLIIFDYIFYCCKTIALSFGRCILSIIGQMCIVSCYVCCPRLLITLLNTLVTIPVAHDGLNSQELSQLKIVKFGPHLRPDDNETCGICIDEFVNDEILTELPCKHYYHKTCVDKWLTINKTCPLCRSPVDPSVVPIGSANPINNV
jgi:hypothetical protein